MTNYQIVSRLGQTARTVVVSLDNILFSLKSACYQGFSHFIVEHDGDPVKMSSSGTKQVEIPEIRIVAFELLVIKHRKIIFINTQGIQKINYYIDNLHFLGLTSSSSSTMESRTISEGIDRLVVSTQIVRFMNYVKERRNEKD